MTVFGTKCNDSAILPALMNRPMLGTLYLWYFVQSPPPLMRKVLLFPFCRRNQGSGVKQFAQGHRVSKWQKCGLKPGFSVFTDLCTLWRQLWSNPEKPWFRDKSKGTWGGVGGACSPNNKGRPRVAQMSLGNVLKRNNYDAKFWGKGEGLVSLGKGHGEDTLDLEEVACLLGEGQYMRVVTVDQPCHGAGLRV